MTLWGKQNRFFSSCLKNAVNSRYLLTDWLISSSSSSVGPRRLMPPHVCNHIGLLYKPCFGSSHLYHQAVPPCLQWRKRPLAGKGGTVGGKCQVILLTNGDFHTKCRDFLPSEGRHTEDFFALEIRSLRLGSNPRTWVPEASVLTHRPPKLLPRPYRWALCTT
jgi:hypothetical protein